MRVGIIGTGAVARKHMQAYANIGCSIAACTDRTPERGRSFAAEAAAQFLATPAEVCAHPLVDFIDVCTFPAYRLGAVELAASFRKHVLVEKPMAINLETAARMIDLAQAAGIQLGVVSQHRFDDSILFLRRALASDRLGRLIQADAYIKWYRSPEYYERPVKGSWSGEGGGALISQAIHQLDLLLHLAGPVAQVVGYWQIGARHTIESEDCLSALLRYQSGATGVIQAATALWPGYPEHIELHGLKGTAIITGDQLTTWDVQDDSGEAPPLANKAQSGASEPMAISLAPFERQFAEFIQACTAGRAPACSGIDGFRALQLVCAIYRSCSEGKEVRIQAPAPQPAAPPSSQHHS